MADISIKNWNGYFDGDSWIQESQVKSQLKCYILDMVDWILTSYYGN